MSGVIESKTFQSRTDPKKDMDVDLGSDGSVEFSVNRRYISDENRHETNTEYIELTAAQVDELRELLS